MQWDAVQTEAKTKGNLVYALDQAQTAVMTEPGPWGEAYGGYCIGLAARWMSLQYQGKDYPYNPGTQEYDGADWRATVGQNTEFTTKNTGDLKFWEWAISPFQLGLSGSLKVESAGKPSGAIINLAVTHAYGCYGITLRREGGAHSIAAENARDNRFHLFDGNYGHFVANSANSFKNFLDWYFDKTGYKNRYTKSVLVIGITPPINHL
jgi:hypothetical protein